MLGRESELQILEELYGSDRFEFAIVYGRRRVGKTTILEEFARRHASLYIPAQAKNDALNLQDFSLAAQRFFDGSPVAPFSGWGRAFEYLGEKSQDSRTVVIIDEFPFLAEANPAIKSILQHAIDHDWCNRNIMLVLCGSNVSFMESEVMGYQSPLYGRSTSQIEVLPFDYFDSARFLPSYNHEQQLVSYGILGGIPRYLIEFDDREGIAENIQRRILANGAFLKEEPQALLRMEVREPARYNSILQAIAGGANKGVEIAGRIREEQPTVAKYLGTLKSMRLIRKRVPCGEPPESKRGIYELADNFLRFWYRFEFSNREYYELLGPHDASLEIMGLMNDYMGLAFEDVCEQYLRRAARARMLPFVPYHLGKWWGSNPITRKQDDVDVLALSKDGTRGLFCECKFKNRELCMDDYDDLVVASQAFPTVKDKRYWLFSKGGFTKPVVERARQEGTVLVGLDELFGL